MLLSLPISRDGKGEAYAENTKTVIDRSYLPSE